MNAFAILLAPAVLITLMIVSHTYLGLHVLERGIIFVDLAVAQVAAQVAALGMSIAFLAGFDPHGLASQLIALAATLIAAFGLAFLRRARDKTTREVAIGCVYVIATAVAIVILSRTNQGMEELKGMLNGNVLWVQWKEIELLAIVYVALAALHAAFLQRFLALSSRTESEKGHFIWEFLFFCILCSSHHAGSQSGRSIVRLCLPDYSGLCSQFPGVNFQDALIAGLAIRLDCGGDRANSLLFR